MRGFVNGLQIVHGARHSAVFNLPVNDGAVAVDGIGVELDPQVSGTHGGQLWRRDGHWRLWRGKGVLVGYLITIFTPVTLLY